jgi:hypothetical protein
VEDVQTQFFLALAEQEPLSLEYFIMLPLELGSELSLVPAGDIIFVQLVRLVVQESMDIASIAPQIMRLDQEVWEHTAEEVEQHYRSGMRILRGKK